MTAVKVLLVLSAFLTSTRGDVRARDPEVEREEDWGGSAGVISATEETPLMQDGGNYPARSGNWCAFVQTRTVTVATACGTEKYTIKSQSPCPSGTPDCHLVMYKLSTRPLYRQKQKVTTALLWRCCPGHGGDNCDDTGILPQQQHSDPNREQNDHQGSVNTPHNVSHVQFPMHVPERDHSQHGDHAQYSTHVPNQDHIRHPAHVVHQDHARHPSHVPHSDHVRNPGRLEERDPAQHPVRVQYPVPVQDLDPAQHPVHVQDLDPTQHPVHVQFPVPVQDLDPAQHPVHVQFPIHVQDLDPAQHPVRVQSSVPVQDQDHIPHAASKHEQQERLHPGAYEEAEPASHAVVPAVLPLPHTVALLLEQLGGRLDELSRDVAELKGARRRERADFERRLDAKVEQSVQQVAGLRRRLESGLHSQHAMLHYNISNLKTDLDLKIKRHNKMLQVSLQAMNATLAELKLEQELEQELDQEQEQEQEQEGEREQGEEQQQEAQVEVLSQTSATGVWEAIERLDNMVVNNSIAVAGLAEELALTSGGVQQLRRDAKALDERLNQTARTGQVLFMETGLEVEAAKVAVLERLEQLAGNLSRQGQRLHELDVDVDYLYTLPYKKNASWAAQCDCGRLGEAVARLEVGVANATELANENRLALEEERRAAGGDWEAAVEALQRSLQQVKDSMSSEQSRTTTLESSVRRLSVLLQQARVQAEAREGTPEASDGKLLEEMKRVSAEMKRLSASFNSLLKDAIRHSDVLEILLGEEVLEFLEWPVQDQEAHSIPALREHMRILQQTLDSHNLSLAAWRGNKPGDAEEAPSADEPSSREQSGGDLWKLERSVEQLKMKLVGMEEAPCRREGVALGEEVARLKRGLEEHLRTFKNVFSNADVLERSRGALELDKLQRIVATVEKKKRGGGGRGAQHRKRRWEVPGRELI